MLYKIITLHGDLVKKTITLSYVHIEENGGQWTFNLLHYKQNPIAFLSTIPQLLQMPVAEFTVVNNDVNKKLVQEIKQFMEEHELEHKIDFISNNGISITNDLFFENNAILALHSNFPIIGDYSNTNIALPNNQNIFAIANEILQINALHSDQNMCIALALMGALRWREASNIIITNNGNVTKIIAGSIWQGSIQ